MEMVSGNEMQQSSSERPRQPRRSLLNMVKCNKDACITSSQIYCKCLFFWSQWPLSRHVNHNAAQCLSTAHNTSVPHNFNSTKEKQNIYFTIVSQDTAQISSIQIHRVVVQLVIQKYTKYISIRTDFSDRTVRLQSKQSRAIKTCACYFKQWFQKRGFQGLKSSNIIQKYKKVLKRGRTWSNS